MRWPAQSDSTSGRRYCRSRSLTLLVPLAVTGHHAGVVALAPAVAVAPSLLRFARAKPAASATLVTAGLAVFITLVSVGSDAKQRRDDASATSALLALPDTWRDEHHRYIRLSHSPTATPLRRASVALAALSLAAFALRRRRSARGLSDIPAATLAAALLLLIATPTKWPWHFGVLIGLIAVAAGTEAAWYGREAARSTRLQLRHFVLVAGVCIAALWSWSIRGVWNAVDVRTLDWYPAFESHVPLAVLAAALPLALLFALVLESVRDSGQRHFYGAAARVGSWAAPVLVVPIIAFTVAILATDAAKMSTWTLARQNVDTLRGDLRCGLADDELVKAPRPARGVVPLARILERSDPELVLPNLLLYFPCTHLPEPFARGRRGARDDRDAEHVVRRPCVTHTVPSSAFSISMSSPDFPGPARTPRKTSWCSRSTDRSPALYRSRRP